MSRYCFYIDRFNVYHALRNNYRKLLWLNYRSIAETAIGPKDEIVGIYYFSAFVTWKPGAVFNHKEYIKALRSVGVEFVQGKFKKKTLKCHKCHAEYNTHEEKQTDVNIAVKIVADAASNKFDKAVIISADSDLIPAIRTVHQLTPEKEVGVMMPIGRNSIELRQEADFRRKMKRQHLEDCQFAQRLKIGSDIVECPERWR
jgi:uncharacterized LabA/DUF88 family protein